MTANKTNHPKHILHPRNLHNGDYDLDLLCLKQPLLSRHIHELKGRKTLDFSDPLAVLNLNAALLKAHYNIAHWQIPKHYLCPPIPGRVDYIHYLSDLLNSCDPANNLVNTSIKVVDIGTGASCIYPILGQRSYQWSFIASDIDPVSIASAELIINANKGLAKKIKIVHQTNSTKVFKDVIGVGQQIDLTMCNPPFHSSLEEAMAGNKRKRENLQKNRHMNTSAIAANRLNFGGQKAELFCPGGELKFIKDMMIESQQYAGQVLYFSCLVSKSDHLNSLKKCLKMIKAQDIQVINMSQGNKVTRFIAWSFLNQKQRQAWFS